MSLFNAVNINDIDTIALTKLDVLSGLEKLKLCIAYEYKGKTIDYLPSTLIEIEELKPIYKELPGWKEEISHIKSLDDLPEATKTYLKFIEDYLDVKVIDRW